MPSRSSGGSRAHARAAVLRMPSGGTSGVRVSVERRYEQRANFAKDIFEKQKASQRASSHA
eukprot:3596600-Prymnesium_polylepis.1